MPGRDREVRVTVLGDSSSGRRALSELDDQATKTGNHFDGLGGKIAGFGKVAALGLAGAAVGVGAFLKSSVDAAEESRKIAAQTGAVITSTGGAAHVSAAQVANYADQLAALTGIDDEVIGATQNLLLTFTNVRNEAGKGNDIFNQATKTATDMATALGTDAKGAAIQLGKALNDPIKGVSALAEVGVTFTEQQKKQIEAMVESGDILGAQKVILKELATEFGGSAEAAASPMARLKVVVGNLQEEIGARLLPVVGKVAGVLADKLPGALDAASQGFRLLVTGIANPQIGVAADSWQGVVVIIGQAVGRLVGQFKEWWPQIKETVLEAVEAIVGWVRQHWPEIRKIISDTMTTIKSLIAGVVDLITTIWENFGDQIIDVVKAAWRYVRDTIEAALKAVQGIVKIITSLIHGDWAGVWEGIKMVLAAAWDAMRARVEFALNIIKNIVSVAMEIISATFGGAWNAIFETCRNVLASVVDVFLGVVETIINAAARAFGWIPGIGGKLKEAARWFGEFRDEVSDAIRGIDGEIVITADTTQAWREINNLQAYARNVNSIELQSQGYQTTGNQQFARGMDMGPVKGAPGEAVPVIAHAGEWVVTPEQMAKLSDRGYGGATAPGGFVLGPGAIIIYALDPKQAALGVRDALISYGKRVPGLGLDG